jgi:NitT/TauT family transport system substrate-binding protein
MEVEGEHRFHPDLLDTKIGIIRALTGKGHIPACNHRIGPFNKTAQRREVMTFSKAWIPGVMSLMLSFLVISACTEKKLPITPDKVTLQLKWVHQAQFAGFYVASEKGFYEDEHIQIELLPGGNDVNVLTTLTSGRADFAVASSELVLTQRQRKSVPITAIAVIYRKSATVFMAKADSGISKPAHFAGKTIAAAASSQSYRETEYLLQALLEKMRIDIARIKMVSYDPSYEGFYSGEVDITPGYYTTGAIKIRKKGHKVNLIWPSDYGIHFYSDTLITTQRTIDKKPDLVERFLRASLKGWRYAIAHPVEAVEMTLKYARTKDHVLQSDMFNALTPLVHTGKDHIGWMEGRIWQNMHQILVEQQILEAPVEALDKTYTLQFLKKIYTADKP